MAIAFTRKGGGVIYSLRFLFAVAAAIALVILTIMMVSEPTTVRAFISFVTSPTLYPLYGAMIGSSITILGSLYVMGWSTHRAERRDKQLIVEAASQITWAAQLAEHQTQFQILEQDLVDWERFDDIEYLQRVAGCLGTILNARATLERCDAGRALKTYGAIRAFSRLEATLTRYEPQIEEALGGLAEDSSNLDEVIAKSEDAREAIAIAAQTLLYSITQPYGGAVLELGNWAASRQARRQSSTHERNPEPSVDNDSAPDNT